MLDTAEKNAASADAHVEEGVKEIKLVRAAAAAQEWVECWPRLTTRFLGSRLRPTTGSTERRFAS